MIRLIQLWIPIITTIITSLKIGRIRKEKINDN